MIPLIYFVTGYLYHIQNCKKKTKTKPLLTFHGHASTEHDGDGEVAAMTGVTGSHHVLGVKDLLGQLRNGQGPVLLGAAGGQGSKAGHEEVETGEGHHVDGQFTQISVQLTRETQARGHA